MVTPTFAFLQPSAFADKSTHVPKQPLCCLTLAIVARYINLLTCSIVAAVLLKRGTAQRSASRYLKSSMFGSLTPISPEKPTS